MITLSLVFHLGKVIFQWVIWARMQSRKAARSALQPRTIFAGSYEETLLRDLSLREMKCQLLVGLSKERVWAISR